MNTQTNNTSTICLVSVIAIALLTLAACTEEQYQKPMLVAPANEGLDTDLSRDKRLNELTEVEAAELCEASQAYADTAIDRTDAAELACVMLAPYSGATDAASCEAMLPGCVEGVSDEQDKDATCNTDALRQCDATVEELETCVQETLDMVAELIAAVSCETAFDPNATETLPNFDEPESCARLAEICPEWNKPSEPVEVNDDNDEWDPSEENWATIDGHEILVRGTSLSISGTPEGFDISGEVSLDDGSTLAINLQTDSNDFPFSVNSGADTGGVSWQVELRRGDDVFVSTSENDNAAIWLDYGDEGMTLDFYAGLTNADGEIVQLDLGLVPTYR